MAIFVLHVIHKDVRFSRYIFIYFDEVCLLGLWAFRHTRRFLTVDLCILTNSRTLVS